MRARVHYQGRMSLRLARMVGVILAAVLLVAQVGPVAAQKGGIGVTSTVPEGTPGATTDSRELDPAALDGLGDLLQTADGGSRDGVPDQIVNDAFGYTIDYQSPWQSQGTWDMDGVEQEYLVYPAMDAWLSVTAWEWTAAYTVQDTMAWWASPENLAGWLPDGQVLQVRTGDTTGAVVFYHPSTVEYPDPWIYVAELHVHDGYAVEITYSSTLPVFSEAYPTVGESVSVNAMPAISVVTADEILAVVPAN